jgi:hypothetical protein
MSYLNQQNIFAVASDIYKLVKERYGLDVEGQYLDDIQLIMSKLWDKNKDKQLKSNQSQRQFFGALNRKTIELVAPGVFRNIEAGYLNKTQNNIYVGEPQSQNPVDLFEKLKKERELESSGGAGAALEDQKNIYSSNNYQNKEMTYDNNLPMTQKVRNNIEPDADAERFIDGQNSRQNIVRDVGPTNTPSSFMPNMGMAGIGNLDQNSSLDAFFKSAANLRGEDTTIFTENQEVEDKFAKLKKQYMQDGQLDRPKDASNRVDDVGGNYRSPLTLTNDLSFVTTPMDNMNMRNANNRVDDVVGRAGNDRAFSQNLGGGVRTEQLVENFFVKNDESKIADDNKKKAEQELILMNQQSNNAVLNYSLIPPEKLNYQTRKYFISVDSLQRDLEAYPLPTNFQVRFEQPGTQVEIPSFLNSDGVVIYGPPVVYQNVGGKGAKLENIYQNIVELKCLDAQIPLDRGYIGGLAPYDFNGPEIDENRIIPNAFSSYPYGPIWKENYGISIDVLDEPYFFLIVDEIDGAYDGTTLASRRALAKLNYDKMYGVNRKFVNLKTSTLEGKTFYPSTWAKLSQMTLQLVTRFNQLLDIGVDKVYIKSIEQGEEVKPGFFCPLKPGQHLTKIRIIEKDPSYGQEICGVGLIPGDRLIFYSIFSCNPLGSSTKLNENVYISFTNYPTIYFYMVYDSQAGKKEKKIDVTPFLKVGDMIIINNKYVLDIEMIDGSGLNVRVKSRMGDFDPNVTVISKGFVNVNKRGSNEIDSCSFLTPSGIRVGGRLEDPLEFQLLYPFEDIPIYLKSPPWGFYRPYEAFYIHAKKQISYTFEVTQMEQNMERLDSRIIPNAR